MVSSLKAVRIRNSLMIIGAPLLAQKVKNLPPMQETRVRSLSREDPLEKGVATHSSILARKSHGQRDTVHSVPKSQSQLSY